MKRKLIVTLVASALELYAAAAGAQQAIGQCDIIGNQTSVTGATPVKTGPFNPVNGFPEYVTDSNGLSLQRCLDPNFCFFDPIIPTDPFSLQIGSGGEAFYYGADAVVDNAAGNRILTYVSAAETAFLQAGPNGEPIDGSQFPFLRLRFTMNAPVDAAGLPIDGTYTIAHPYGTDVFTVTGATGHRDVFATVDKGFAPNTTVQGSVGPFLLSVSPPPPVIQLANGSRVPQFIGDAGPTAVPDLVTGSPCGRNYVEITGVDTSGNRIDFGGGTGEFVVSTQLFSVQGQRYDGIVQTALVPTRVSYSRSAAGAGQIETFATSSATASVTVVDGPTIAAGTGRIADPLTLDHTVYSATEGTNSLGVPVADASVLPAIVQLTATDGTATDPTSLNMHLVDFVDISQADYDPATGVLSVSAASGDARSAPTLTLRDYGTFAAGSSLKLVTTVAPPSVVHVDSAAGGSASAQVRVIESVAPLAPSDVVVTSVSATTLSLGWADLSRNESGFQITVTPAAGGAATVVTTGSNATSVTVTGLSATTVYTVQIAAYNGVGSTAAPAIEATTLALPAAPTTVTAALATTPARSINVSFTDNAGDETRYTISRATTAAGIYTSVGTLTGAAIDGTGARTFVDSTATLANNTTYFYRVVAERVVGAVVESSAVAQAAVGVTTPAAPTSLLAPTFTGVTSNSVTVNWVDRATNETSFDIYRSTVATGGFVKIGSVAANVVTFTDNAANNPTSPPVDGTTYFYRVNSVNWAASVNGGVSAGVVATNQVVNLAAPTGATATTANTPVLAWTDNASGETAYRVTRTPITVNATTGAITAGTTTVASSTIARLTTPATGGRMGFTEPNRQANNSTIRYDILALNGTTGGTPTSVYAITSALPDMAATPTTAAITGGGIRVNWTASTTATVGGYEIQRCTGVACTNFNTLTTVSGRATATFPDTTATVVGTTYRYRIRAVGGVGTSVTPGAFSATVTRVR